MLSISIGEICDFLTTQELSYELQGMPETMLEGFSGITNYRDQTFTWVKNRAKYDQLLTSSQLPTKVALAILPQGIAAESIFQNTIVVENPKLAFFAILAHFYAEPTPIGISPHAVVAPTAIIGKDVFIGDFAVIGEHVVIGDHTQIHHHAVIDRNVTIGKHCVVKSHAVIGEAGHGYSKENNISIKVPHFGSVTIGDYVDIGNGTCIDRGTIDDTSIGNHVKIDNLCHIGHNVVVEDNVQITAQAMLAGSVVVQKDAYIAPSVVLKNQITIGQGAIVGIGALVLKDMPADAVVIGAPAKVARQASDTDRRLL